MLREPQPRRSSLELPPELRDPSCELLSTNASQPLPTRIAWPATAQFALPRVAINRRSREFLRYNVRLTEVAAPLKSNLPKKAGTSEQAHTRNE